MVLSRGLSVMYPGVCVGVIQRIASGISREVVCDLFRELCGYPENCVVFYPENCL